MIIDTPTHIKNERGFFVVLEGVNGAGKSSLLKSLELTFLQKQTSYLLTREPGASTLGREIRKIVLENSAGAITPVAELMLFCADRAQHVSELIAPALAKGQHVLCDRFTYSTEAFQGYGRGIDLETIKILNQKAIGEVRPNLVLLLDIDPKVGLDRITKSRGQVRDDRFESEELAFHTRVRNGFLEIAKSSPDSFVILDAAQTEQQVAERAKSVLARFLGWQ